MTCTHMFKKGCLRIFKSKTSNTTMRERELPVTKLTPNHIPSKKCDDTIIKSYSLDFSPTRKENELSKCGDEKLYIMYVAFILKGRYILAVQRRAKSFNSSTFQVVLWEANEVKEEVENMSSSRQELLTVSMTDEFVWTNQMFDLNFSEIHQVHVSDGRNLTIVGRSKNNEVIQQFNFSSKKDSDKIRMKSAFVLSLTARRMVVKKKTVIPILRDVNISTDSHAIVVALTCDGKQTCFVYQITSFSETRWIVCLYNGHAKKTTQQFQYFEVTPNIVRGSISSACFLKNESKIVLVTTAFQLLTLDIEKNGISLRNNRLLSKENILFDSEHENIFLQKLNYKCLDSDCDRELVIACSTSGRLFFIPESLNSFNTEIHSFDVSSELDVGNEKLYVQQFSTCDFTKQCILTCRSGRVYTFDILKKIVVQKTNLCTGTSQKFGDEIDILDSEFYYQLIDLNWFGDELYHLQDNRLHVHLIKPSQTALEDLCRAKILENFPVEEIMRSNIPSYVRRIAS